MSSFAWWDARVAFCNTIEILLVKLKETIWTLTKTKLFRKQSASLKEKWWRYFQSYSNVLTVRSKGQRSIEVFAKKKKKLTAKDAAWKVAVFGVFLVCIFRDLDWIQTWKTPNMGIFHAVRPLTIFPESSLYYRCLTGSLICGWVIPWSYKRHGNTLHVKHRADTQTKQLQRQFNMRDCF